MLHATIGGAFEPDFGASRDIELAVGIVSLAVATGLFVRAGAMDRAVVLSHVEVERPRAELTDHLAIGGPEFGLGVTFLEEGGLGGVVAHEVEVGVGQVGLEAEGLGLADAFEGIKHRFPGMHACPADFTFGGDALAVVGGDLRSLLKSVDDAGGVRLFIFAPLGDAELGRVDADDAVFADAMLVEQLGDATGLIDREQELLLLFVGTHRRISDRARPDRRHERTDVQALGGDQVGHLLQIVFRDVGVGMGVEKEEIHAIELMPVDVGGDGHVEHVLEGDGRVIRIGLLADEAGPHGVVQFHDVGYGVRGRVYFFLFFL